MAAALATTITKYPCEHFQIVFQCGKMTGASLFEPCISVRVISAVASHLILPLCESEK